MVQLEDCFRQIVSLPSTQHEEKEEITKDLANCLENMIKKVTKLVDLDALEKDCRKAQFYLQNDELREKVNQVCYARRVELGKSTFSPEKSKNSSNSPVIVILLAVLFVGGILAIGLRLRKKHRTRKTK